MSFEVRADGTIHLGCGRVHLWIRKVQTKEGYKVMVLRVSRGVPEQGGSMQLTWENLVSAWVSKAQVEGLIKALIDLHDKW